MSSVLAKTWLVRASPKISGTSLVGALNSPPSG